MYNNSANHAANVKLVAQKINTVKMSPDPVSESFAVRDWHPAASPDAGFLFVSGTIKEDAKMLSQIEFRVVDFTNAQLEEIVHDWLRQAIFFIGASWYTNQKDFKTIYDVSAKLKLRWIQSHGITRAAIEQLERGHNWIGGYWIGDQDPFLLECFARGYTVTQDTIEIVERIVKAYLPFIEIVQCGTCGARFDNTLQEEGWRCDKCLRQLTPTKDKSGFVYIFGSLETGYFKIGCGDNPAARMRDYVNSGLPFPVEMIHVIPVDDKLKAEAELHRLYREQRTNGEWFKLSADDLSRIKGLSRYVGGHWSTVDPTPAYGGVR